MTYQKPEDKTIKEWLSEGLNLKTVLAITFAVISTFVGAHYAMGTKITIVDGRTGALEQKTDSLQKQLDYERDVIDTKVSTAEFLAMQKRIDDNIAAIRDSQERIEMWQVEKHR